MTTVGAGWQVEANKAAVRRALEGLSAGDVGAFVRELAPNYVRRCQSMPPGMAEIHGPAAMGAWLEGNKATFPDYHEELETLVGEGDLVAWRSIGSGTMTGAMGPFSPTGRRMSLVIIGVHRFEHGKIAETWTSWDNLAALRQLGLVPAP